MSFPKFHIYNDLLTNCCGLVGDILTCQDSFAVLPPKSATSWQLPRVRGNVTNGLWAIRVMTHAVFRADCRQHDELHRPSCYTGLAESKEEMRSALIRGYIPGQISQCSLHPKRLGDNKLSLGTLALVSEGTDERHSGGGVKMGVLIEDSGIPRLFSEAKLQSAPGTDNPHYAAT